MSICTGLSFNVKGYTTEDGSTTEECCTAEECYTTEEGYTTEEYYGRRRDLKTGKNGNT